MWTTISRFLNFSYEMIARFTHRTYLFLSGFRRLALPWSKPIDEKILPTDSNSTYENQSLLESNSIPLDSSTTIHPTDSESTTVFVTETEIRNTMAQPPTKKLKLESSDGTEPKIFSKTDAQRATTSNTSQDSSKTKKKKLKGPSTAKKIVENKDNEGSQSEEPPRPNHFIAIQVSNAKIMTNVHLLQQKILSKVVTSKVINKFSKTANIFKDTMVKKEKLHFTLHVFHLKDDEEKERAKAALEKCYLKYKSDFEAQPMHLNIEGLGHFRNGVIFAKIQGTDHVSRLEVLSEDIRREFTEMSIPGDQKPFRPHLTIAKLSKSKTLAKKKIRSYPLEIWCDFKTEHLGYQTVESLQLLSMMDTNPTTGYYGSIAQFDFNLEGVSVPDGGGNGGIRAADAEDVAVAESSILSRFESAGESTKRNANSDDYIGEAKGN